MLRRRWPKRRRGPSARGAWNSRRAPKRTTRSAPRRTPVAKPRKPRRKSIASPTASGKSKRASLPCTTGCTGASCNACGLTSGWTPSAASWRTSRRSRKRRASSGCSGRGAGRGGGGGGGGGAGGEACGGREQAAQLAAEMDGLDSDSGTLTGQRGQWVDRLEERRTELVELERAATDAEAAVRAADEELGQAEVVREGARGALATLGEEEHRLQLERSGLESRKRSVAERAEIEWRKPLADLLAAAPDAAGDVEWLRQENERLKEAIDAVGPVNALAVEEHAEEQKRLEFLMTQRDDLVAARTSLQQAAREIDQTAKTLFLQSFGKVRENFRSVFQTLFGGGECDVRLANEDEPLDSEIEIHAAPRGKRTQRIPLLSSGERTLVAVSLLFAIFLTMPSPFCLLDEVDAPLDDANVGRYVRLLAEFKEQTQFIVITHNPRTMQAADAVYGVTMQEPGVSTIVGVRLGQTEAA